MFKKYKFFVNYKVKQNGSVSTNTDHSRAIDGIKTRHNTNESPEVPTSTFEKPIFGI